MFERDNFDKSVLIAAPMVPKGVLEQDSLKKESRPFLIEQLNEKGIGVYVSRGAKSFDADRNIVSDVVYPEFSNNGEDVALNRVGEVSVDDFDAVRNSTLRYNGETNTPFINPNAIRNLGRDKYEMANGILVPSDSFGRHIEIGRQSESDQIVQEKVANIPGDYIVAKPNTGMGSEGIIFGKKDEVLSQLGDRQDDYNFEELLDFSAIIPHLQGIDDDNQLLLNYANLNKVKKELRIYYFGKENSWDAVLRATKRGESDMRNDIWVHVDLDSIPIELSEKSIDITRKIQEVVGLQNDKFYLAIDWVYASTASNKEPRWSVMEVNATDPVLVSVNDPTEAGREIGRRQHSKMATLIDETARQERN